MRTVYSHSLLYSPGFSYRHLIDYLYSKVLEYRESEQDCDDMLSPEWKAKVAASLVPRGLEMSKDFSRTVSWHLHNVLFEKIASVVRCDERLDGASIEDSMRAHHEVFKRQHSGDGLFWARLFKTCQQGLSETATAIAEEHFSCGHHLERVYEGVVLFAKEAYAYNTRISSELSNQPKPVDSIVDNFAVEAQNFANSLTLSTAFAAGAASFRLIDLQLAAALSAFLGAISIVISFGTLTNAARYKIRNEEARVDYVDNKLRRLKKAAFALVDRQAQQACPLSLNPFVLHLEESVNKFRTLARYYDYKEPDEFNRDYEVLKKNVFNLHQLRSFQKLVACKYIASSYHVNSYVQESLVQVYRVVAEMIQLLSQSADRILGGSDTATLLRSVSSLEPRLKSSLQRGAVQWGFIKRRSLVHWDIIVCFRYIYNFLWCSRCSGSEFSPIQNEIHTLLIRLQEVSSGLVLRREIRDLEMLYWATRESEIASLITVFASLTLVTSVILTAARVVRIQPLIMIGFYSSAVAALGAALAASHFIRKSIILHSLSAELRRKATTAIGTQLSGIQRIQIVTHIQLFLTVLRLVAATASSVALPFIVAETGFGGSISTRQNAPFYIAFAAVLTAVASSLIFLCVEYIVRYNLPTHLGPFICELFRFEIEQLYDAVLVTPNDIDSKESQSRDTWSYVARDFLHQYRFDAVFAADRFGQILQYIQGGMNSRGSLV